MKPAELRTERLLLRPFQDGDAEDVFAYADDAEWSHFLYDIPQPYSLQDAESMVSSAQETDWRVYPIFAVVLEGHVIGRTSADISARHNRAELGWGIARAHWGKGIAHEGVSAMIDFLFSTYELPRVFARADGGNERSWRLMDRLGMQREALLRSHRVGPDGRSDEIFYGLLREEWEASKR
jgi:RimJ/RimL family protein N-acetyltransferase